MHECLTALDAKVIDDLVDSSIILSEEKGTAYFEHKRNYRNKMEEERRKNDGSAKKQNNNANSVGKDSHKISIVTPVREECAFDKNLKKQKAKKERKEL